MDSVSTMTVDFLNLNGFMDKKQDNGIMVFNHPLFPYSFALVIGTTASNEGEDKIRPFGNSLQFAHTFKYRDWMGNSMVNNSRLAHGVSPSGKQSELLLSVLQLNPAWHPREAVDQVASFVKECIATERAVLETYQDQIIAIEKLTQAKREAQKNASHIH